MTTDNNNNNNDSKVHKKEQELFPKCNKDESKEHDKSSSESESSLLPPKLPEIILYKYGKNTYLAEAVLANGIPMFLQMHDGEPTLNERIKTDNMVIVPHSKREYLSKEYAFSSIEEIRSYVKRAKRETMNTLFVKVKNVWKKYFDIDENSLNLCSADTIFTYFQDRFGMTHYLFFVGDNSSGKSNALRILLNLGYRPMFDTSITPANIYNFLNSIEEGQGIILEDEIDGIDDQEEKREFTKAVTFPGQR